MTDIKGFSKQCFLIVLLLDTKEGKVGAAMCYKEMSIQMYVAATA